MYFNSFVYVFAFLPLVFAAYLLLRRTRFANLMLAIASFVFYAWLAVWYLVPMLISAVIDYFVGLRLHASDSATAHSEHRRESQPARILIAGNPGNESTPGDI